MSVIDVDEDLLQRHIEELGRIGLTSGEGLFRFQYEAAWQEARDALLAWMSEAGLSTRVDAVGNIYGRLEGRDSRTVLTGSHMDTVPSGGRYDGALGIVGGLAALAALKQRGTPDRSIEVVALCEEESSRFNANFFGTRGILGLVGPRERDQLVDRNGVSLARAMEGAGLDPDGIAGAARDDVLTFVELHIEQGRVLYDKGIDIGLVDVIPGLAWETVVVSGRQDHAGSTPMDGRRDAMQASAEISRQVTKLVEHHGGGGVVTAGRWSVEPGWPSIVPGRVEFSLDLRHPIASTRDLLLRKVQDICEAVAAEHDVDVETERIKDEQPATMDDKVVEVCRQSVEAAGFSWQRMNSGAGHDSQLMSTRVPTAMIFVPSIDGLSHRPDEATPVEDCVRGATALAGALERLAYGGDKS